MQNRQTDDKSHGDDLETNSKVPVQSQVTQARVKRQGGKFSGKRHLCRFILFDWCMRHPF